MKNGSLEMISYNNWIQNNADSIKKGEKYKIILNLFPFANKDFHVSADLIAKDISEKYNKIYVGFSGGMDSEYVVRCFHRNKINFIPIIAKCEGSQIETNNAEKVCHELKLKPKILFVNDNDIIKTYNEICQTKILGDLSILRAVSSKYAHEKNGFFVTGHTTLGETGENHNEKVGKGLFDFKDHDNLLDALEMYNNTAFYLYHPSIVYSIVKECNSEFTWNQYKTFLYGIDYRDKKTLSYKPGLLSVLQSLKNRYNLKEIQSYSLGNKDDCLKLFKPFILQ